MSWLRMIVFQDVQYGECFGVCMYVSVYERTGLRSVFDECTVSDLKKSTRETICCGVLLERREQVRRATVESPFFSFLSFHLLFPPSLVALVGLCFCFSLWGILIIAASCFLLTHLTHLSLYSFSFTCNFL